MLRLLGTTSAGYKNAGYKDEHVASDGFPLCLKMLVIRTFGLPPVIRTRTPGRIKSLIKTDISIDGCKNVFAYNRGL